MPRSDTILYTCGGLHMSPDRTDKLCRFTNKPCSEEHRLKYGTCEWEVENPEPVEDWELQHLVLEV